MSKLYRVYVYAQVPMYATSEEEAARFAKDMLEHSMGVERALVTEVRGAETEEGADGT